MRRDASFAFILRILEGKTPLSVWFLNDILQ